MGKELWLYKLLNRIGLIKTYELPAVEKVVICPVKRSPERKARKEKPFCYKKASKNGIKYSAEETKMICEITRLSGRCSEICEGCVLHTEDRRSRTKKGKRKNE